MSSRRILITGLSSLWGGRLAQALEREDDVLAIVGVDTTDPRHQLQRTEFVRVDTDHAVLRRIISAASIDTVIDTRLVPDPLIMPLGRAHEVNVIGTRNVLTACGGPRSPVRKVVFKSSASYYGCERDDPAFLTEAMTRSHPPRTAIERDIVEAETAVADFAAANPSATVTILRAADAIGGELRASHLALLNLPVVPSILGFDPRCQFIHQDDLIGVLAYAARHDIPGIYNVAGDGVLALSEVASLLGKPLLPVLPPWGTVFAAVQLRRLGLRIPVEMLRGLRFGQGLDNRLLKATGYTYRYTSREAVLKLRAHQRLRPLLRSGPEPYRYEREVEEFLRWSPSVQATELGWDRVRASSAAASPTESWAPSADDRGKSPEFGSYDELTEGELIDIIASLDTDALSKLRSYEASHRGRGPLLDALDQNLARRRSAGRIEQDQGDRS
jgi:UDP-glucose 4-epimerase